MATPVQSRALLKSLTVHALVVAVLLALPAGPWRQTVHPEEDVEVVFHPPTPPPPVPLRPIPVPAGAIAAGVGPAKAAPKAPVVAPKPLPPGEPIAQQTPDVPSGPVDVPPAETPQQRVGKSGLLAFKDQIASVATDKTTPNLGTGSLAAADDVSRTNNGTLLVANGSGGSGGIDLTGLSRQVGGGGGGGTGGGMQGVSVGRATSSIAGIGGGRGGRGTGAGGAGAAGDGSGRGNPGNSRTDEEIQIVFDRHKASFYRLYHKELQSDPTLRGQIVIKLTIEPDGSVSMCALQSSDMKAPDLAAQVVSRVREINFGAKEGVRAMTIVYPIDFLPAA